MNAKQENKESMALATDSYLDTNAAVVTLVPLFVTKAAELKTRLADIIALRMIQEEQITGPAEDKQALKLATIDLVMPVVKDMKAYALSISDMTLYETANYSRSKLLRKRDTTFSTNVGLIIDIATTNLAAAAGTGLTAPMIADASGAKTSYDTIMTAPREKISNKAMATQSLVPAFVRLDGTLDIIKNLGESFTVTNPAFAIGLDNVMKIVDSHGSGGGGTSVAFNVTVIDSLSGGFVCVGAIVTFGAQTPIIAGTDGKAHIAAADTSLHNIAVRVGFKTVTVTGYNPADGDVTVDMGFGMYTAYTYDSLAPGFIPSGTIFNGVGAGNCVLRSDGRFTVDDGSGHISYRSILDHTDYDLIINYATGEVTVSGSEPPDGTNVYRPAA